MNFTLQRYWRRSRSVETLIEDWDIEHDHAKFALDVEELAGECIDLATLGQHAWMNLRENLVSDPNCDMVDESENVMKQAMAKTLKSFARVQEFVAAAAKQGVIIKNLPAFETAVQEIHQVNAKIEMVYPPFDHEMVKASMAEFERGEWITSEQLIEELTGESQGVSAPTH
jgi:hypothetical protein